MKSKTQYTASGIAFCIAAVLGIIQLFSTITDSAYTSSVAQGITYTISVVAFVLIAICFFIGKKRSLWAGGIIVAVFFIYLCLVPIGDLLDCLDFALPFEINYYVLRIAGHMLFALSSVLLLLVWAKGYGKSSLRTMTGIIALLGAACVLLSNIVIVAKSTELFASVSIYILWTLCCVSVGIGLFIASLAPADTIDA